MWYFELYFFVNTHSVSLSVIFIIIWSWVCSSRYIFLNILELNYDFYNDYGRKGLISNPFVPFWIFLFKLKPQIFVFKKIAFNSFFKLASGIRSCSLSRKSQTVVISLSNQSFLNESNRSGVFCSFKKYSKTPL